MAEELVRFGPLGKCEASKPANQPTELLPNYNPSNGTQRLLNNDESSLFSLKSIRNLYSWLPRVM